MVELVDTRDLKSLLHCGGAGSNPAWGTKQKKNGICFDYSYLNSSWLPIGVFLYEKKKTGSKRYYELLDRYNEAVGRYNDLYRRYNSK